MATYFTFIRSLFFISFLFLIIHGEEQSKKSFIHAARLKRFFWPGYYWITETSSQITPFSFSPITRTRRTRRTTSRTPTTTRATLSSRTTRVTSRQTSTTARLSSTTTSAAGPNGFTNFQIQALTQTNTYRATHCAPPLSLNASLNAIAQAYANKLAASRTFSHSSNGYGENLYMFSSSNVNSAASVNGADAVKAWYEEVNDYTWSSPGFSSGTGHFTQLVWISSKQLGTGVACTSAPVSCYIVANYWPPGNYQGAYPQNVKPASC